MADYPSQPFSALAPHAPLGREAVYATPVNSPGWNNYAGYGALASSLLLPLLAGAFNGGSRSPGNSGYLPGSNDLYQTMQLLARQQSMLEAAQAPEWMLNAARNAGRQESAVNGIGGALGATVAAGAQGQAQQAFDNQRFDRLAQLSGLRSQTGLAIRQQEMQQRMLAAQAEAQKRQGKSGLWSGLGGVAGAIGGGILGLGNPAAIGAGASIGSGLGGLGYSIFG